MASLPLEKQTGRAGLVLAGALLVLCSGCGLLEELRGSSEEEEQGPPGFIGSPCLTDADCDYEDGLCLRERDGYPGGLCSQPCERLCPDLDGHPITFCIESTPDESPMCHSRCDFGLFPGTGCRPGYRCRLTPRSSEPEVQYGTCLVDDGLPDRYSDCLEELIALEASFDLTSYAPRHPEGHPELTCSIEDPVALHSPIRAVDFCGVGGSCSPMLMSCQMALAMVDLADIADELGLVAVEHWGTVNCRTIAGTDRLSQHALGMAIDLTRFFDLDDTVYSVEDHWEADTDQPRTPQGRLLHDLVHELHDRWVFNVILTPDYNAAHRDHFHLDLTEGEHFLKTMLDGE
ncbi:MAG: extensin family protein [Bradymonadales bacterium]|nr:extensin family protein [Bradymonadales bacterium]